ncbi:hypothetical protein PQR71_07605 [Paraburkholderia fungorum]|uniref:hypothetical protein n=1 Tax=Paraburkholderia fungorum TaxID=134537 RepID=UPI0038BA3D7C
MAAKPQAHQFGKSHPSEDGNFNVHVATSQKGRDEHFRPLTDPLPGKPPFHLDIADILSAKDLADIKATGKLTFHVNGDMGGIDFAVRQQLVAEGMEDDFSDSAKPSDNPAFLYILGD